MIEDINDRWYVVSLTRASIGSSLTFGAITARNLEGYGSYIEAQEAMNRLPDPEFPVAIIFIDDTFDRVNPEPDLKLITKKVPIDPWEVL